MIKGEFKSMKYAQISDILTLEFNINYVTQLPTFFHFFKSTSNFNLYYVNVFMWQQIGACSFHMDFMCYRTTKSCNSVFLKVNLCKRPNFYVDIDNNNLQLNIYKNLFRLYKTNVF